MSKYTGGPAFPQPIANAGKGAGLVSADEMFVGGMTLRDYFAAKAMQGLLSNVNGTGETLRQLAAGFAEHVYRQADAMLAERSKP